MDRQPLRGAVLAAAAAAAAIAAAHRVQLGGAITLSPFDRRRVARCTESIISWHLLNNSRERESTTVKLYHLFFFVPLSLSVSDSVRLI